MQALAGSWTRKQGPPSPDSTARQLDTTRTASSASSANEFVVKEAIAARHRQRSALSTMDDVLNLYAREGAQEPSIFFCRGCAPAPPCQSSICIDDVLTPYMHGRPRRSPASSAAEGTPCCQHRSAACLPFVDLVFALPVYFRPCWPGLAAILTGLWSSARLLADSHAWQQLRQLN